MNGRMILATSVALLLAVPTGAAEPLLNQVDNGGFEDFDGQVPDEWRLLSGEVVEAGHVFQGDKAVRLNTVGDAETTTLAQNVSLEREDAPVVPNGTYDLDFAALLDQGSDTEPTTPPEARAKVLWKDALGDTTEVDVIPIAPSTETYQAYNVTLDAPIDAVEAEVQFDLERTSAIARTDSHLNVDDVAFGPALPS